MVHSIIQLEYFYPQSLARFVCFKLINTGYSSQTHVLRQASKGEEFCFLRSWLFLLSASMKTTSGSRACFGVAVLPAVTFLGRRLCRAREEQQPESSAVPRWPCPRWPGRPGATDRKRNKKFVSPHVLPQRTNGPLLCCSRCPH